MDANGILTQFLILIAVTKIGQIHLLKWTDSEADMLWCNGRVASENPFSLCPIVVSWSLSIVSIACVTNTIVTYIALIHIS